VSVAAALPLLACSLALTLGGAATFARRLDRLGARHGLPEVWIGILTALAADGPEISSALIALARGSHGASVGVIVGSCTFNLATMLGLTALVTGAVVVTRATLALEGAVALIVTATVIALLAGGLPAGAAAAVAAGTVALYLLLALGGGDALTRLGLRRLAALLPDRAAHAGHGAEGLAHEFRTRRQLALIGLDLALIVGGSFGMVSAALSLGHRWGVAAPIVGALVLGPLTSLPNALTGVRLGLAGRGAALVTETLNSNTINLLAGVAVPSLFVTLAAHSDADRLGLALLGAAMAAVVALLAPRRGLGRAGALVLLALYAGFVAVTLG